MTRYGMLIDARKCVGCRTCVAACQNRNGLEAAQRFIRFEESERGAYPSAKIETLPLQCMHCEDAPCAAVCPTGAAAVGADGIVTVDQGRCIGCKYCMAACPYQVRSFNEATGTVDKCRYCVVADYESGEKSSTCVSSCPTGVRVFGDLDDPNSALSQALSSVGGCPVSGDLTKVKTFYVR